MKSSELFDYEIPFASELKEMYITPYRFSDDLKNYVDYMYSHPVHNKHFRLFASMRRPRDLNDMLQRPYLFYRYFLDYPQRFDHNAENIVPHMIVSMWKTFLALHKLRGKQYLKYYPASMKLLTIGTNRFMDILEDDVKNHNIIYSNDDMVKTREGKTLRERNPASLIEGSKHFEYLCGLE